ncbi:glycosyltransferase [Gelidibacter sp. F2691]|nr:glycosyltransferase [Gelidibacter sp. F2691]
MIEYKQTPLVSIIMVVYNSEEFLEEAIMSVINANYRNLELIISDDCSTDTSWDIITSFDDPRIRAFKGEVNKGEYKNRKFCIDQCRGDYFVFVDGDDTLLKDGLDEAVLAMENSKTAAFGVVRPPEENYKTAYLLSPNEAYNGHFLNKSRINLSFAGNIFRTNIVKAEPSCLSVNLYSGDDFIRLFLASKYDTLIIVKPFAEWRSRPDQASQSKNKVYSGLVEPYKLMYYFISQADCPLNKEEIRMATKKMKDRILIHALVLIKNGNYKFGIKLLSTLLGIKSKLILKPEFK